MHVLILRARIPEGFPPHAWYQLLSMPVRDSSLLADGPRPVYVQRRERARPGLVPWSDADAYLVRVTKERKDMLDPWWGLLRSMIREGLLDESEARGVEPRLEITIQDARDDQAEPIPELPPARRPKWAESRE